jgi:hypothetical protein
MKLKAGTQLTKYFKKGLMERLDSYDSVYADIYAAALILHFNATLVLQATCKICSMRLFRLNVPFVLGRAIDSQMIQAKEMCYIS